MRKCVLFIFTVLLSGCFSGLCGYKVQKISSTNNGSKILVKISKGCGATTVPTATYYIVSDNIFTNINVEKPKIKKKYKIFSHERGAVKVQWDANDDINVQYDFRTQANGRKGHFLYQTDKVENVNIFYKESILH